MSASHQVWHRSCGTLLLHSERPLSAGDKIRAEGATLPDGTRLKVGAPIRCPACDINIPVEDLTLTIPGEPHRHE